MTYSFNTQYRKGNDAERFIYEQFQGRFSVIPAPSYLQEQGVDFTFTDLVNHQVYTVELKTDTKAAVTGNVFIETVSVDRPGEPPIPGWIHSSTADWLLYYLPNTMPSRILRISFDRLRDAFSTWNYSQRRIPNKSNRGDYHTVGMIVPLEKLNQIAEEIIEL